MPLALLLPGTAVPMLLPGTTRVLNLAIDLLFVCESIKKVFYFSYIIQLLVHLRRARLVIAYPDL